MGPTTPPKSEPIVIIGAGVFGLGTALELKKRGYQSVTVLDRHLPPVPDGSSVDINRVIRVDYADELYAKMAREAHHGWTSTYRNHYYESGFVMFTDSKGSQYIDKMREINEGLGQPLEVYDDARDIRKRFPAIQAKLDGLKAFMNQNGGWADAQASIQQLATQCSNAGVSFVTGARGKVLSLRFADGGKRVTGINVGEGDSISASQVILSTGAWTNRLISVGHASSASGQPVGFIKVDDEMAARLREQPVMINISTGIFVFPPYPGTNIVKVARHGYGFATSVDVDDGRSAVRKVSSPRRDGNNAVANYLPADADEALREGLRQLVPEIADHPWLDKRLCWYSDTPEGDFIVDGHPNVKGLFFATAGAGHAFKFLPVLGQYVVDCFENKAPQSLRYKWRLRAPEPGQSGLKGGDGSRAGPPLRVLNQQEQAKL